MPRTALTTSSLSLVLALLLSLTAGPATASETGDALAARVAAACGADHWAHVRQLDFTWTHQPSSRTRSYAWDVPGQTVAATIEGVTTPVPVAGPVPAESERAHGAFVNDSYWLLFELHLAWDQGVTFDDLGPQSVPEFADLGQRRALSVQYGAEGGYTPGDRYVLYLGDDDRPVAWAYHRTGASEPTLVTTREEWKRVGDLMVPTRFVRSDGSVFITIDAVQVR